MSSSRKHKSKSSSSTHYPTGWSEWSWNDEYRRQYRWRLLARDVYDYDWAGDDVPRNTEPPLEDDPDPGVGASSYEQEPEPEHIESIHYTTASAPDPVDALSRDMQSLDFSGYGGAHIKTKNIKTQAERFDPHYKVHRAKEFKWGKIFKVLWAEPGGNGNEGSTNGTISVRQGNHGEQVHKKVRRFVVVKQMDGHCICLPINTYSGQGANKHGVHAEHHAVIHTSSKPHFADGEYERGLIRVPIRVTPFQPRHKLDPMSRLNYAKLYTVEYNVKVWFIGEIHQNSQLQLTADYNHVHPPMYAGGTQPSAHDTTSYALGGQPEDLAPYSSSVTTGGTSYSNRDTIPEGYEPEDEYNQGTYGNPGNDYDGGDYHDGKHY